MELHHRPMLGAPPSPKGPVAAGVLLTAPEDDFHSQSVVPFDFEESDDEDQFRGGNERAQADEDIFMKASRSRDEKWKWWKVYMLHFLFMFNSRTYEFASIILIAQSFPNNLTTTSIRGMSSTIASLLCASAVGSSIDRSRTRLPPLLTSIFLNHAAIVLVYICWMIWPNYASDKRKQQDIPLWNIFLFAIILILDIIQDLSDLANKLSVERDLIPVLVGPVTPDMVYGLTQVNSVLKRIDFFCKLAAPSLLPLMISSFNSTVGWLLLLACGTTVMWALEVWCAFSVAKDNKEMTEPKEHTEMSRYGVDNLSSSSSSTLISSSDTSIPKKYSKTWSQKAYTALYLEPSLRLKHYFSTSIWQASIAISFLQLTVLAYSATLITYLLEVGFLLPTITIARGTGSAMSFISTFVTPWVVQYLRKRHSRRLLNDGPGNNIKDDKDEHKIVRKVGLWGIWSQFLSLVPVVIVLWNMSPKLPDGASRPPPHLLISVLLFSFLSLSRFGHLTFELMLQEIEQVEIASSQRSTFAGTEQSFESLAVLGHWAATIVWNQPEDFKLLALGSLTVMGTGAGMYAVWVRRSRPTHVETRYEEVAMEDVVSDGVERHS